ncbi:leukocyte receptor cluster member 8 homolog [Episyrphus balteatus]|uniref:leukocyte receptor cluster member 8 homolog n=1 Tax=Episyrphus balteatus TaxID=286459 RepID=UPI0024853C8B|nr:leukocyte receptor cluster member 8 homolog [Episyrphus balteatus]
MSDKGDSVVSTIIPQSIIVDASQQLIPHPDVHQQQYQQHNIHQLPPTNNWDYYNNLACNKNGYQQYSDYYNNSYMHFGNNVNNTMQQNQNQKSSNFNDGQSDQGKTTLVNNTISPFRYSDVVDTATASALPNQNQKNQQHYPNKNPLLLNSTPARNHLNRFSSSNEQQQQNKFSSDLNHSQEINNFGGIRFNLNQRNRLSNVNNPLNLLRNNPIGGKKKRKRNKNNKFQAQQQLQQQQQQHQQNLQNRTVVPDMTTTVERNNSAFFDPTVPPPPVISASPDLSKPPPPLVPAAVTVIPAAVSSPPIPMVTDHDSSLNVTPVECSSNNFSNPFNPADAWPESLNTYVQRCYAKCVTDLDKDQIDICLKGKITAAATRNELWTRDWNSEPIPSVHSESNLLIQNNLAMNNNNRSDRQQQKTRPGISKCLNARLGQRSVFNHRSVDSRSRSRSPRDKEKRDSSLSPPPHKKSSRSSSSESSEKKSLNYISFSSKTKNNKNPRKKHQQVQKNNKVPFQSVVGGSIEDDSRRLQERAARFGQANFLSTSSSSSSSNKKQTKQHHKSQIYDEYEVDTSLDEFHIVGTSRDLEKSFLRLTKAPMPNEVRPIDVLESSLRNVKTKWRTKQDYYYACDQLKSIRQDLTVQGIRDKFTVEVYETHARIAMEKGDHEEFNQCQTQLKMLYTEVGGSNNILEFISYRILYYIFTKNTLDITTVLRSLTPEQRTHPAIAHALELRSAWALGNYCAFFNLYKNAPLMSGYLIDWFILRERKCALKVMIKSYRPSISIDMISRVLAFVSLEKCREFLESVGAILDGAPGSEQLNCKNSMSVLQNL